MNIASPTRFRQRWNRFGRHRLAVVGLVVMATVTGLALFADQMAPRSPTSQQILLRLKPPGFTDPRSGAVAWLGTDHLGRDILSRIIHGSRVSLAVSLPAVVVSALLGMTLGLLAGYYRGGIESVVMRGVDLQLAFPFILLALSIVALMGPSLRNIIIVFAATTWPVYARTTRGVVLALRAREFVEAARSLGASDQRILWRHVAPGVLSPVLVLASFEVARMIILEASLGFLGLGVPPPTPTWGSMLADGRDYLRDAWWIAAFPGLAIMVTAAGSNFLGDGLRDVLDPTLRNVEG
ncbi:MAG TPA: ABC transporter permease [Candidatus Binatia bacterium]|nr:ABC transporter permease [Candidatus Binatia bacterium]